MPEAAVTDPETVNLPEPVTDSGETDTVTESVAAVAVNGATTVTTSNSDTSAMMMGFM